jgi:hypothetical protein
VSRRAFKGLPRPADVRPEALQRAEALKEQFLDANPEGKTTSTEFREKYEHLFSKDGLAEASPEDFKYFANAKGGASPGNMAPFNIAWNRLGSVEAATRVRESIEYLLYPNDDSSIDDRLTSLIEGRRGLGMKGFREALLTKVLCVVEPQRFIPILTYTSKAGKREYAKWVYDLDLPEPAAVSWTIGQLIFWSNDLLVEFAGKGFEHMEHVGEFLWWAKDQDQNEFRS